MLDKTETLNEQIQRNTIGHCENKSDPKFDHDYNTDYSRILLPNYNPLKIIQEGRSPHHHHHQQQQLLQYLQETHYRQQLQGLRYRHSPPLPSSHCFHSHCCFEQESGPRFVEVKAELRSTEEEEGEEEEKKKKKQGLFLSPSHKECKRERRDDGERRTLQQQQQRPLLGLHPNTNITGLKRRTPHGHGNVKQQRQTCHSNQQAYKNSDKKMDTEKDVHIKVDDDDDIDIDVAFGEDDNKERMTCKFTNCNDDDDSNNSSINGRSCSISSNSSGSSTNSSICSGDEDDVDSGIDGGHHNNNNNNHNDSNNIELQRKELRIIDLSPTQITSNSATTFKDSLGNKNTRMKQHDDTEYQHQIMSKNNNMRETSLLGECAVYYQHRRTPPDSPPSSQQQGKQLKKLSAIFTNEDTHNPPDLTRKFTNFFIDDILKPEFGKKPFETGTTTIRTVGRKLKFPSSPSSSPPCSSSSFPFSISSLSQSSLLSSSSFSSITSHNSGKKKSFSRYAPSDHSRRRCSPSKSSSVSSQEESPRSLQVESVNKSHTLSSPTSRGTAKKKDLTTTGAPVDPKSNENSTEFQFKYPAWVFCTRYSDRPSSGPRSRKMKRKDKKTDEKRPRTAFTPEQLQRLKREFDHGRYLTEERRQALAKELGLNESQIKIWFQNKRAKMKKVSGAKNPLALQLIAEGLYNHQTNKDSP